MHLCCMRTQHVGQIYRDEGFTSNGMTLMIPFKTPYDQNILLMHDGYIWIAVFNHKS